MQKFNAEERAEISLSPAFRRFLEMTGVQEPNAPVLLKLSGRPIQSRSNFGRVDIFLEPDRDHIVCVTVTPDGGRPRSPNRDEEYEYVTALLARLLREEAA